MSRAGPKPLRDGDKVPYRGRPTTLRLTDARETARHSQVKLDGDQIVIALHASDRGNVRLVLERWMRRRAREAILEAIEELDPRGRLTYGRIYIMDQRTRWGGCSAKGNLSFNWRLVMAPPHVLRYVVAHELAHTEEPKHSPRFWLLVGTLCEDWQSSRRWLRDHGGGLRL